MRIVYISEEYLPQRTGVSMHIHHKLKWFNEWGLSVKLIVPDYSILMAAYPDYKEYTGLVFPSITVSHFPTKPRRINTSDTYLEPDHGVNKYIDEQILYFKPDIIHIDSPDRFFLNTMKRPALCIARRMKIPITAFYHTHILLFIDDYKKYPLYWYTNLPGFLSAGKLLLRFVYNAYDITMVPSPVTHDYLKRLHIKNVYNDHFIGVDTDIFNPAPLLYKKKNKNHTHILNISRYDPDKQVDTLLSICNEINKVKNCFFTFVGHGIEDYKIREWVKQKHNAEFIGSVSNSETAAYYKKADIFITAANKENQSVCILEAMACGLPVIGPDQGGIKGMVEHGKTGFIVPAGNIDAYVNALCEMMENENLRLVMAEQSYKKAQNHTCKKATTNMIRVWERLME